MKKAVILMGPPGSGKSTQRHRIIERYDLQSISTGDIAREIAETDRHAAAILKSGEFLSDEVMTDALKDKLSGSDSNVVIDGYPRNTQQAKELDEILESLGMDNKVIYLEVSRKEILRRLETRYICKKCGRVALEAGVCSCGGPLEKRVDDNEVTIKNRLDIFETTTKPILDVFKLSKEVNILDGEGTLDEVSSRIYGVLDDYFKET